MQRYGHKLTITTVGNELIATCECGKWRLALPASEGELLMLVGKFAGKHGRHMEGLGHASLMGDSGEGPLIVPENPAKE